jgi:hypothetical protein
MQDAGLCKIVCMMEAIFRLTTGMSRRDKLSLSGYHGSEKSPGSLNQEPQSFAPLQTGSGESLRSPDSMAERERLSWNSPARFEMQDVASKIGNRKWPARLGRWLPQDGNASSIGPSVAIPRWAAIDEVTCQFYLSAAFLIALVERVHYH